MGLMLGLISRNEFIGVHVLIRMGNKIVRMGK